MEKREEKPQLMKTNLMMIILIMIPRMILQQMIRGIMIRKKKSRRRKSGGRKAGSGIITVLPVVLGILVAVFVIYLGAMAILGPRRGECKQLIARFEEGCQTLNVNEIAYCFKPATRNTILAFTTIGGVVTDSSSEEVLAKHHLHHNHPYKRQSLDFEIV